MTAADRIASALERIADQRVALCVDADGLAVLLGVSLRSVRRLDDGGKIPAAIELGTAKRWRTREIEEWLAAGAPVRKVWESR